MINIFKQKPTYNCLLCSDYPHLMLRNDGAVFRSYIMFSDWKCDDIDTCLDYAEQLYNMTVCEKTKKLILIFIRTWIETLEPDYQFKWAALQYIEHLENDEYPIHISRDFIIKNEQLLASVPISDKSLHKLITELDAAVKQEFIYVEYRQEYSNSKKSSISFDIYSLDIDWKTLLDTVLRKIIKRRFGGSITISFKDL